MVTIRDVSKRAGVSVATVSRVLNNKGAKKETIEHVLKVMEEMNYQPNAIARSLSNKKTNTIALIIPALSNPFFPELASAIENIALLHEYKMFLFNCDDNRNKLMKYIDSLASNYVDGVIIDSHTLNEDDLRSLRHKDIPVVAIDRSNFDHGFTTISVNNKYGGQMATEHLLAVGCKRIGHLRGPLHEITASQRLWGYRTVVNKLDWFDPSWVSPGDFTVEGGYQGMKELLIKHPNIDGVFTANDLSAIGAMKAAYEWNRKIPEELAIVGFDGIDMTRYMVPTLTTIRQPIEEIGKLAMEELLTLIEKPNKKMRKIELEVKLLQQESTMR